MSVDVDLDVNLNIDATLDLDVDKLSSFFEHRNDAFASRTSSPPTSINSKLADDFEQPMQSLIERW